MIRRFFLSLKVKYYRWQLKRGLKVLEGIDDIMEMADLGRTEKRQFWRDFIKKHEIRDEVFKGLGK